jgi:multidrug transporter EmrE-like cation transporter
LVPKPARGVSGGYILLHAYFLLYSCSGIFAKSAAGEELFSVGFNVKYALVLLILLVCALLWQIILRMFPLTVAFANKGVTVIWGVVWGCLFFAESLNPAKLAAIALVLAGIACIGDAHE